MVWGYFIVYSDRKIALELDLTTSELSLPGFSVDKNINDSIKKSLSIDVEEFEILNKNKDSLFALIGEWEGKLRPNGPLKRIIWLNIKDAIEKIEDNHKSNLTFFRENYREVILGTKTIGIASISECEKYNLATRRSEAFIFNKDDYLMLKKEENNKLSSLSIHPMLCESHEEAIYRLLTSEFGILTEIKHHKEFKDKMHNVALFTGNLNQSLTFSPKNLEKALFRPLTELKKELSKPNEASKTLSDGLKSSLKAYFEHEKGLNA